MFLFVFHSAVRSLTALSPTSIATHVNSLADSLTSGTTIVGCYARTADVKLFSSEQANPDVTKTITSLLTALQDIPSVQTGQASKLQHFLWVGEDSASFDLFLFFVFRNRHFTECNFSVSALVIDPKKGLIPAQVTLLADDISLIPIATVLRLSVPFQRSAATRTSIMSSLDEVEQSMLPRTLIYPILGNNASAPINPSASLQSILV